MAACEAILLAEFVALVDNEPFHSDAVDCPDPAEYDVAIGRPDRNVHLVIGVCGEHQALIAATTTGYLRSIRKHAART